MTRNRKGQGPVPRGASSAVDPATRPDLGSDSDLARLALALAHNRVENRAKEETYVAAARARGWSWTRIARHLAYPTSTITRRYGS